MDHRKLGDNIAYVIRVRGRTKYLVNVKDLAEMGLISKAAYIRDQKMEVIRKSTITSAKDIANHTASLLDQHLPATASSQSVEFCIVKRYSELLAFHNVLKQEMKNYLKKNGYQLNEYPEFPPKKLFFANTASNIQGRIREITGYFDDLFRQYP